MEVSFRITNHVDQPSRILPWHQQPLAWRRCTPLLSQPRRRLLVRPHLVSLQLLQQRFAVTLSVCRFSPFSARGQVPVVTAVTFFVFAGCLFINPWTNFDSAVHTVLLLFVFLFCVRHMLEEDTPLSFDQVGQVFAIREWNLVFVVGMFGADWKCSSGDGRCFFTCSLWNISVPFLCTVRFLSCRLKAKKNDILAVLLWVISFICVRALYIF